MDKLVHTALNSIANLRDQRIASANNLANMNVPGFRRDLSNDGRAFSVVADETLKTRSFQLETGPAMFSQTAGFLDQTGEAMDLAIADKGYFYIQPDGGGDPALTRRGDLRTLPGGQLVNGAGERMLDEGLQPIVLPPFRRMSVDETGMIRIEPQDGAPGEEVAIARLATVVPDGIDLRKGDDGMIRQADGGLPPPDARARVLQGVREGSNVNPTEELIASIDLQRSFEINLRMITTAKEIDEAGSRLMRMPEG